MNPALTALIVFVCLFGAALLGMRLRSRLPSHHLSAETKDAVRIGMGSVATMAALVLGLLVSSTKEAYDVEKHEIVRISAKIVYLDQVLANYGAEASECRAILRESVRAALTRIWPETNIEPSSAAPVGLWSRGLPNAIQKLVPQDSAQRTFKWQASRLANSLGQMRWLLFEQIESSVSVPLVLIVVFWLALTFVSVGLFAPPNSTALIAQVMAALAVSGAIFLILELNEPFGGILRISSKPMMSVLEELGK